MADYRELLAGTNIDKNPELPAPKKIVGYNESDIESGQVEAPLTGDRPIPPPSPPKAPPKPKVKREIHITEKDNGYIMTVYAGEFREEWVFLKMSKMLRTIAAFLNAEMEE